MSGLDLEHLVLVSGPIGPMQACLGTALPYAHEWEQFGSKIGEFQLIQAKLADLYAGLAACCGMAYSAAVGADAGHVDRKDCAAVIL